MKSCRHLSLRLYSLFFSVFIIFFAASCAPKYQLTVNTGSGGSVAYTPEGGMYKAGSIISLEAQPSSGYYFTGWGNITDYSVDSAVESSIEIIMPEQSIELSAGFSQAGAGWTFMIYMAGDQSGTNSLSPYVPLDLEEVSQGLHESYSSGNLNVASDVTVLVLTDKLDDGDTVLYLATSEGSSVIHDDIYIAGAELNLGDGDVLKHFIQYGMTKYPSQHNALILWNHGGGVKTLVEENPAAKEICQDGDDSLYLNELQEALTAALRQDDADSSNDLKLDIIGMDACLMGELETAYELIDSADYFVASMAEEWAYGWDYSRIFNHFDTDGAPPTAAEMADILVTQYRDSVQYGLTAYHDTMTAVKLSEIDELVSAMHSLAAEIKINYDTEPAVRTKFEQIRDASVFFYTEGSVFAALYYPYHDIYSFCRQIVNEAEPAVFSTEVTTAAQTVLDRLADSIAAGWAAGNSSEPGFTYNSTVDSAAVRGLSVFIPCSEDDYHYSGDWYTNLTMIANGTYLLGEIDFCYSDSTADADGTVETWRELFEAWYDPANSYTPGSF